MSNLSVQGSAANLQSLAPAAKAPEKAAAQKPQVAIEADAYKRGAGNGALRGGLVAAAAIAVPGIAYVAVSAGGVEKSLSLMIAGGSTAAAGITGAVAGAVSSQMTDSPFKGAVIGVLVGAATGAATAGAIGRSWNGAATGAVIGAIGGLIGGAAGSYGIEKK